jgi:hypothetical protein
LWFLKRIVSLTAVLGSCRERTVDPEASSSRASELAYPSAI